MRLTYATSLGLQSMQRKRGLARFHLASVRIVFSDVFRRRRLGSDLRPSSASADIAESRPPSLPPCSAGALEEFLAASVPVQPHFGNIASFCFCSGAITLQQEDRSGGSRACKAFLLPHVSHVNKEVEEESEQGGWDGMCTRGHVISMSEWIGVPALRRAHLLPPSRAPSLLVGWLADCIRQQICIFNLGSSRMGGRKKREAPRRAEKSFARPTGGDASMRAAWASDLPFESRTVGRGTKYGRTGALEHF